MKILVLGGDGYRGWPEPLHLSDATHGMVAMGDFARRAVEQSVHPSAL